MCVAGLTHRFVRLVIAAMTVAIAATTSVIAQQGATSEVVATFNGIFVNGRSPSGLIEGRDGNFYGTRIGGLFNAGTIFRIDAAGVLTTLDHFSGGDDGERVIQYTPHGGANRQWLLRHVE